MARFTVRVELHDATAENYSALHEAMKSEGFSRTITDRNGTKYRLPTAEYNRVGNVTRQQVFEAAQRAAQTMNKKFAILVTEATGRTWDGLPKVI